MGIRRSMSWRKDWFKARLVKEGKCLLYNGSLDKDGYGRFTYTPDDSNKAISIRTHRFAFLVANGYLPKNKMVLHTCDTPACCNPDHLFLGTALDNSNDKISKGRQRNGALVLSGTGSPLAKLTESQVREVRASKISSRKLAVIYGLYHSAIDKVRKGRSYKNVK